jgi:hypothetical protein
VLLPLPYPDELVYSMLARGRIRFGFDSPKAFLKAAFDGQLVRAVPDLQCYLDVLAKQLGPAVSVDALVWEHTLFPMYAPFIPAARKTQLVARLKQADGNGIHTAIGMAAGRASSPDVFRYCPECLQDMLLVQGEYYWKREWQVTGFEVCPDHLCLLNDSMVPFRPIRQHEFITATPDNCIDMACVYVHSEDTRIKTARLIRQLLALGDVDAPGYWQWTHFYRDLAKQRGCLRGKVQVRHQDLWQSLGQAGDVPGWFERLFRKHRASMDYQDHLWVWQQLCPDASVTEILQKVGSFPDRRLLETTPSLATEKQKIVRRRVKWKHLLKTKGHLGVKTVRMRGGQALYGWLYRRDRAWLLETNRQFHLKRSNNDKTDWPARDRKLVRVLIRIRDSIESSLEGPHRSRQWYINQLPHRSSVAKHLHELPLCSRFLDGHAETVTEHQIRRLTREIMRESVYQKKHATSLLLRRAGLSKERMTAGTEQFLKWWHKRFNGQSASEKFPESRNIDRDW